MENITTSIPNASILEKFEECHPKLLQWDVEYKKEVIFGTKSKAFWLEDEILLGEIIITWQSTNVIHVSSITVFPQYQGQGYGKRLVEKAMTWAKDNGFEYMTGEARKTVSWSLFKKLGAKKLLEYENWGGCSETYILFKIKL